MAAPHGMAGALAPCERHARQRSHEERQTERGQDEETVVAGERRHAREQAREGERPARSLEATRPHPEGPDDERLIEREVVRLGHVDRGQRPGPRRGRRRPWPRSARPGVAGDGPGEGRGHRADQGERQGRRPGRRAHQPDERHLDERGEGHPMRVRRDGEGRVRRDDPADLGKDPDGIDGESVPGGQGPRDVHVVERIGIRRVRKVPDEHDPNGEGESV